MCVQLSINYRKIDSELVFGGNVQGYPQWMRLQRRLKTLKILRCEACFLVTALS